MSLLELVGGAVRSETRIYFTAPESEMATFPKVGEGSRHDFFSSFFPFLTAD